MKGKRLKWYVVPIFSAVFFSISLITIISLNKTSSLEETNISYVSDSIIDNSIPVVGEETTIVKPFQSDKVEVYKKFYDGVDNTENAIIYYNGIYMQSSGIIYNSNEKFSVVAILDGEIVDIKEDDLLGSVVEVKHNDRMISRYQGLKNLTVKKGDHVKQNTILGMSGELKLDESLANSLFFELIVDGKYVNPDKYYDTKVQEM
ncbi:MAG: M23 family metallopeptidase [Bacilli bacterium]|nr:M23 family metallopeptidase [Bacilli bacterium]